MLNIARSYMRPVAAVALAGGLAALAGCGGGSVDTAKGKQLFTQRCGSCHVLADAGTKGVIGPNLDDAFRESIADGLGRDTIEGIVKEQIAIPQGKMPANLVTGKDAEAVAAYVADVAARKGGGAATTTPAEGARGGAARANARNEVQIPADPTGQLQFRLKSAAAKAGKVTLSSKNDSTVPHNISVKGAGVDRQGPTISGGKTSTLSVSLKPGQYTFYCSVPGHEEAGMKGTLTIK